MVQSSVQGIQSGNNRLRIDFDTSVGDLTYTMLKQTLGMAKEYVGGLAIGLKCTDEAPVKMLFPDMGSAALARKEWKVGEEGSLVPPGVEFGSVRDSLKAADAGCIVLCPRNSEADDTVRLMRELDESAAGQFMILINPELVNMETTGFGLAGRKLRQEVLAKFTTVYYLRTLAWGAIVKEAGRLYSIWEEDDFAEGGYKLLESRSSRPSMTECEEIHDIALGLIEPGSTPPLLDALGDFVRDFGRL
ncbi:unnamed protein product [Chrysoparadoxa australica]